MARTGPKLSKNPGRTARFYRKNKKSREKHRRDQRAINSTPAKKAYRGDQRKIRENVNPDHRQICHIKVEKSWQSHVKQTEVEAERVELDDTITTKP